MKKLILILQILIVILTSLGMISCKLKPPPPIYYFTEIPVYTLLLPSDLARLRRQLVSIPGVDIVQQGAKLKIVLFTDYFFQPVTTKLEDGQDQVIQMIALYLHNYLCDFQHPYPLTIEGYTDTIFPESKRMCLASRYAMKIACLLEQNGFCPEQLRVIARGCENTIGNPFTVRGRSYNRRVVIRVF